MSKDGNILVVHHLPRGVRIKPFNEGPLKGGKIIIIDIVEFIDIKGPDPNIEMSF